MQAMETEEFLEHHGVKGMKWGVRRAQKAQSEADRARKVADRRPNKGNERRAAGMQGRADRLYAKQDKKWEKSIYTQKGAVAVHNEMATRSNKKLDALNNNPKYKDTRPLDQPGSSQLYKDYIKDYESLTLASYHEAVTAVHGSSPSGKKRAVFVEGNDFNPDRIEVRDADVKHADVSEPDLVINVSRNSQGLFNFSNFAELEHYDMAGDFLEHFGVKGMKWGVIRSKEQRQANRSARADTRIAVRKVQSKGIDTTDAGIKKARQSLPDAERKVADARDRYKVDKHTTNKIEAKRPLKVAAADLHRIRQNAEHLTKDEQFAYDMMDAGRAVVDAFSSPANKRTAMQKVIDLERDKQRIREASAS